MSIPYCENELMELLKKRDRSAFNHLYENYSAALYSVIIRHVKDHHLALDILQEVFINIWKNIDSYDTSKGRFYSWIHKIARNRTLDYLRSKMHCMHTKSGDAMPTVSINTEHRTNAIGIKKLVGSLSPKYKEIVQLYYFNGYTLPEISQLLEMPLGTVKTRLRHSLTILRKDYSYLSPLTISNHY